MQLHISRQVSAQKGMLGGDKGNNYQLSAQLEVDPDELALIERHKLQDEALTTHLVSGVSVDVHTVGKLLEGHTEYLSSLSDLAGLESKLISASRDIAGLMEFARSFDEGRVVELRGELASLV